MVHLLAYFGSYTLVIYIVARVIWQMRRKEKYSFWKDKWIVLCGIITLLSLALAVAL